MTKVSPDSNEKLRSSHESHQTLFREKCHGQQRLCLKISINPSPESRKQVEAWQGSEFSDLTAKVLVYDAFMEAKLKASKPIASTLTNLSFEPRYEEFCPD